MHLVDQEQRDVGEELRVALRRVLPAHSKDRARTNGSVNIAFQDESANGDRCLPSSKHIPLLGLGRNNQTGSEPKTSVRRSDPTRAGTNRRDDDPGLLELLEAARSPVGVSGQLETYQSRPNERSSARQRDRSTRLGEKRRLTSDSETAELRSPVLSSLRAERL